MEKYRRIFIEGDSYYKEYNSATDSYGELLSEDEFVELILDRIVDEEVVINERQIACALHRVSDREDRDLLETYIRYLERINQ